ncbi:MAG TPA: adenine deaminase [Bacteroidetes bacterium]|nr:adenine deaminase [Bacteroidota bacterium]HCN37291.1 adenine deaminase [Bacteroidota bacterium]
MEKEFEVEGNITDIFNRRIFPGKINVSEGRIVKISETDGEYDSFILPGFIDAHIHIESSMLIPSEFARVAVKHGMVATVSDPHEIANVLGIDGIRYMINNGSQVPFKFYFGASSCVPATDFETSGDKITGKEIEELFEKDGLLYLSEMMNYPGVLFKDDSVMEKISIAKKFNKPVDGHAPGLRGEQAKQYIDEGISTDHECFTFEEALEKLNYGMKIIIREGSAAKNYNALHPLIKDHYENLMFCSDDRHPDDLLLGEIDLLVKKSISLGYDLFNVLKMACINPVEHYGLDVGLLREGDKADFITVNNLKDFKVLKTVINGETVFENGKSKIRKIKSEIVNKFNATKIKSDDIKVKKETEKINVIKAINGEIVTESFISDSKSENDFIEADIKNDILKLVIVERYNNNKPAVAFINGFGLKSGAIASTVAHDSHNIIATGVSDEDIVKAINLLIDSKGGVCAVNGSEYCLLELPIAGLMSGEDAETVAKNYQKADELAKRSGSKLDAPFMTLSFMALLVIPTLKLSDKGLFDGKNFKFTSLQV